jgi:uncharacterized membrane protein YdjX (TVP38/TMEM64 family)
MNRTAEKSTNEGRQKPWKWIGLGLVALAIVLAGRTLLIDAWLMDFDQWIAGKGAEGLLIFTAGYAAATVLFIPGSVLTLGAGFVFGIFWGTVVASLGSTVGDTLAFLIARYLARKKIQRLALGNRKFAAMDEAIGEHGWKIVLLLRLSPLIPFNMGNYLYGLTAIRFWPYVLASWVGVLPGNLLFVYLGAAGKASLQAVTSQRVSHTPLEMTFLASGLVATVIATWYVSRIARKALRKARVGRS